MRIPTRYLAPLLGAATCLVQADQPTAHFYAFNDWVTSDARGVRISAEGDLRLAPHLRRVAQLPEGVVWAAVPDGAGGAYLSASTEGRLFHYAGGQVKPLAQVKGGIVFAMVRMGQDLIVAPTGEDKLFRVTPAGDVKPFADIESRLVWAMAVQGTDLFLAGGGDKGAVLTLAREGSSRRLAQLPDETAFTAITPDGQGGWYLGTHGRGLVCRYSGVQAGDHLETLLATGFEEIRALVVADGEIFVGATNGLSGRFATGTLERAWGAAADPGTGGVVALPTGVTGTVLLSGVGTGGAATGVLRTFGTDGAILDRRTVRVAAGRTVAIPVTSLAKAAVAGLSFVPETKGAAVAWSVLASVTEPDGEFVSVLTPVPDAVAQSSVNVRRATRLGLP